MKASDNLDELLPRFKLSKFRAGDILLSTVQKSAISAAIRAATGSRFSHAAIHWRSFAFLEAIDCGVCTFNVLASAICDRENVRVLRLKDDYGAELTEQAADAAYALIGREYWVAGAIRAPLGVGSVDVRGRLFCSYLVAEAFARVGVDLCPGKPARFVTPADITSSPLLNDVTDSVLYEAEESELRGIVRLIDGHDPATPQTEFREAMGRILARIRLAFHQAGLPTPNTLPHAMATLLVQPDQLKRRALDVEVSEILENAGYPELPRAVLFRQTPVGFDEETLSALPLRNLEATISTHRTMVREWIASNADRRRGLEEVRQRYGDNVPFRVLEIQARHEQAHWAAMEVNISILAGKVRLMEQFRSRHVSPRRDA